MLESMLTYYLQQIQEIRVLVRLLSNLANPQYHSH